jgi:hypothetical protein
MLWTLIGITGASFGVMNLRESLKDIHAIEALNGNRLPQHRVLSVIAYGHYRNDLFRLAKQVTIIVIGVIAMIIPPQNPKDPVTPVSLIVTGGLFTIAMLLVLASALDRRQREIADSIGGVDTDDTDSSEFQAR